MDLPLRRKISHLKEPSDLFQFLMQNVLLLSHHLWTEMSSTLLRSPLGPKKTGQHLIFMMGFVAQCKYFSTRSLKDYLQNGHLKNIKKKAMRTFNYHPHLWERWESFM